MSRSADKYQFIFRYIYGLTGLVAIAAISVITLFYLAQRADLDAYRRVTYFHLESTAIAERLRSDNRSLLRLLGYDLSSSGGIPLGGGENIRRGPDSLGTLQMIATKIDEIQRLNKQYGETEFDATLDRIEERFRSVDYSIRRDDPADEPRQAILSFDLAVLQFQRLHTIAAERVAPDVATVIGRTKPYLAVVLAILIAAGIIWWMTMRILHKAVEEQAYAEKLLAENIERMRHLEKLESIGRLVGGVAHDFNNLLTAILGQTGLLLEQVTDERARHGLNEIREAGRQAASLTRQLLDYSRPQPTGLHVVSVNALIKDIEAILIRVVGDNIGLTIDYGKNLAPVELEPAQLQQVIVNLSVNARDAMPDGGKLSITTASVTAGMSGDESGKFPAGRYTRISVSDTGLGMDDKTLERVFEPYFTTKDMGRGTGLGLSTVYGIINGAGGYIEVHSTPGRGSRFDALLPASEKQLTVWPPGRLADPEILGNEKILVVEDDESVRTFLKEGLERLGYQVYVAADAGEGMDICNGIEEQIDVILTDVILPGKNGLEFIRAAREPQPDATIVLMSGYTDDVLSQSSLEASGLPLIHKPFEISDVAALIRTRRSAKSVADKTGL